MSYDPYNQQPQAASPYDPYQPQFQPNQTFPSFGEEYVKIQVEELFLIPTGTYQEQYRHPWGHEGNSTMAQNAIYDTVSHAYRDFVQKKDAGQVAPSANYAIDPNLISGVSSLFMKPVMYNADQARLHLAGNLGQQTCRFLLTIAVYHRDGLEPDRYLINGYTSYFGIVTKAGRAGLNQSDFTIDPQMEMTVNTIMQVNQVTKDYGYGPQTYLEMQNVKQVLLDTQYESPDNASVVRMRPYEVATSLARRQDPQLRRSGTSTTDTRYMQTTAPEFSDVHNTNPNDYMAKVLSGLVNGRDLAVQTNQSGQLAPFNNAVNMLRESNSRRDPFLKAISNYRDSAISASFKFRDLLAIDPNADNDQICHIQLRDFNKYKNVRGENMAMGTDTSYWNGGDLATQWAVQMTNMLPPMMMDLGIRKISVVASNSHRELLCKVAEGAPFIRGVNIVPQLQGLETMFYHQFLRPMSEDNQFRYDLDVTADLYGELVINIGLNGGPKRPYVYPAFMSAASAPVLTSNRDHLDNLSDAFQDLQKAVLPAIQPLVTDLAYGTTPSGSQY